MRPRTTRADARRPGLHRAGSPQQNAYVERFNGTMRDEKLNGESFHSVLEARVVLAEWLEEYNTVRPHRGHGMRTPQAFLEATKVGGA